MSRALTGAVAEEWGAVMSSYPPPETLEQAERQIAKIGRSIARMLRQGAPMTPPPPPPVPCDDNGVSETLVRALEFALQFEHTTLKGCVVMPRQFAESALEAARLRSEQAQELEMWKELAERHEAHIRTLQASLHEQGNRLGDRAQELERLREKIKELEARVDRERRAAGPTGSTAASDGAIQIPDIDKFLKDGETAAECIARNREDTLCLMKLLADEKFRHDDTRRAVRLLMEAIRAHGRWCGYNPSSPGDGIHSRAMEAGAASLQAQSPAVSGSSTAPSVTSGGAVETTEANNGE